jgi:F-type H+-transporting ATPase subunit gamma
MAGLKAIKTKIRSVEKTRKVTKAMEAVSAAKMRKAQQKAIAGRAYARAAVSILSRISGSKELQNHPLVRGFENSLSSAAGRKGDASESKFSSPGATLYIVITSDKGLAGALNSAVLRAAALDIKESGLKKENVSIIAIGKKANEFFALRGYKIERYHPNTDEVTNELLSSVLDEAAKEYTAGNVSRVAIVYQNFISTFEQRPTMRTIFPLSLDELQKVVSDIVPAKGVFSKPENEDHPTLYTIEPSDAEVMNAILPRLAGIFVYHALLESQASEHSARMVSMKSASDKAGEMRHSLTLKFNKARQAAITREVSEITGGMEAMTA